MRYKFAMAFQLLIIFNVPAIGQDFNYTTKSKTVMCADPRVVIKTLNDLYKEIPIWITTNDNGGYIMLQNELTKTWTLLQIDNQFGCMLAVGTNQESLIK
jgi:hypothetical protein